MIKTFKGVTQSIAKSFGYEIVSTALAEKMRAAIPDFPPDFDSEIRKTWECVKPFTMTSKERVFALCKSVEYVVQHQIPGAIVECGVWKGGSMMAIARTLLQMKSNRTLYLFDTFDGMTEPISIDRDFRGVAATDLLAVEEKTTSQIWCLGLLDEVKKNLESTGYEDVHFRFVKGRVEETIPVEAPNEISILRLDTDWFESTYHELRHLYPRLSVGGVLIIDDYGHWKGAQKAVDQYMNENNLKLLLNRIDYTGRICVKIDK